MPESAALGRERSGRHLGYIGPHSIQPLPRCHRLFITREKCVFPCDRHHPAAWGQHRDGVFQVLNILALFKGRIHHDPVVWLFWRMVEEIAELDIVILGVKHVFQRMGELYAL